MMKKRSRRLITEKLLPLLLAGSLLLSGNPVFALGTGGEGGVPGGTSSSVSQEPSPAPGILPEASVPPAPSPEALPTPEAPLETEAPEEPESSAPVESPVPTPGPDVPESPAPTELPGASASPEALPSPEPECSPSPETPSRPQPSPTSSPGDFPTGSAPGITPEPGSPTPSPSPQDPTEDVPETVLQGALVGAALPKAGTSKDMSVFRDKLSLHYLDSANTELPTEHNADLSLAAALQIRYEFTVRHDQLGEIADGDAFQVELPPNSLLTWQGAMEIPLYYHDPENAGLNGLLFATVHVSPGGVYVTFVNGFSATFPEVADGYFYLNCGLDQAAVGDQEQVTIQLDDTTGYTVNILENQPKAPQLKKSNAVYENDRFHWTVHYTGGVKDMTPGAARTIVDRFDSSKQTYLAGSATVNGAALEPQVEEIEGETVLTFSVDSPKNDLAITYDTTLSDGELKNASAATTVVNGVELRDDGAPLNITAQASGTADVKSKVFLVKSGTETGAAAGREIPWRLEVKTHNRTLGNLTLHDQLPKGLELDPATFQVLDGSGADVTGSCTLTTAGADPDYGNIPTSLTVAFPGVLSSGYTVSYTTKIRSELYNATDKDSMVFDNKAWLTFDWTWADGTLVSNFQPPEAVGTVKANLNAIQKTGIAYDPATHRITWKVTVNPYGVDFTSATVTDDLAKASPAQSYVPGTFRQTSGPPVLTVDGTRTNEKKLTVTVGALGTDAAEFTFDTLVDDEKDYAFNHGGKDYKNTALCEAYIGGSPDPITCQATGRQPVTSTVVKKEKADYNYDTHEITWKISVNENRMPLTDVKLVDVLEAGQTYVPNSAARNDGGTLTERLEGQTLTLDLGDLNGVDLDTRKPVVTFRTILNVDEQGEFGASQQVRISNTVTLERHEFDSEQATGDFTVKNEALQKQSAPTWGENLISYSVGINPNRITFQRELDNYRVTDTLPPELLVDLDTVELYEASVAPADGALTKGGASPAFDSGRDVAYDPASREMTVSLPDGANAYVLEYDADVVEKISGHTYTNRISFLGDRMSGQNGGDNAGFVGGGGGGGGLSGRKGAIEIRKTDGLDGSPLAGATFILYQINPDTGEQTGQTLNAGETDEQGALTFSALTRYRTYRVEETVPPQGYVLPETPYWDVTVEDTVTAHGGPYQLAVSNARKTGEFSFLKTNPWGRKLTGAKFLLTPKAGTPGLERTAVSAGGAVSFSKVPFGEYTLMEIQAPENHKLSSAVFQAVVDKEGGVSLTDELGNPVSQVSNDFETASVRIVKTNQNSGEPMEDVEFIITDSTGETRGAGKTGADGILTFTGLMAGETYTVHETRKSGFLPAPDREITLTGSDRDTVVFLPWENMPMPSVPQASVRITKVDASTGDVMPGVEFEILNPDGLSWGGGVTDEKGVLVFEELPLGVEYILRETTPQGYLDSPDRKIEIVEEREYPVLWENTPEPPTDPGPTPTPAPSPPPENGGNSQNNGGPNAGTPGGSGQNLTGQAAPGKKLPQTGRNQLAPYLTLGAGLLLAGAGTSLLRRKRGRHEK